MAAITANAPNGSNLGSFVGTRQTYAGGTRYIDYVFNLSTAQANGSMGAGELQGTAYFQFLVTPVIVKANTQTLSLTFRYSWARRP